MVLREGDKIHVIARRGFEQDLRRHFAGEVVAVSDYICKAVGHVFVLNPSTNRFSRKPEKRTRIVSLIDAGNIINILPSNVNTDDLNYVSGAQGHMTVTDGASFTLDIQEFLSNV